MDQLVAVVVGSALLVFGAARLFTIDETRTRKTPLWTGIGCVIGGVILLVAAVIG